MKKLIFIIFVSFIIAFMEEWICGGPCSTIPDILLHLHVLTWYFPLKYFLVFGCLE